MTAYAAFLRAVNVGGTGKLPMQTLVAMCEEIGFQRVKTYIASGNLVFIANHSVDEVSAALEARLLRYFGKSVRVHIRTIDQLKELVTSNPFPHVEGNRHLIMLLDDTPNAEMITKAKFRTVEELRSGERALHIHYPEGQGVSRLKLLGAEQGTARNVNTVKKLIALLAELD